MVNDDISDYGPGEDPTTGEYYSPAFTDTPSYLSEFGMPGPGWAPGQLTQPMNQAAGGMGKPMLQLLTLLLAGGGLAGMGQNLFGRPPTTTTTPRLSPEQLQFLGASQGQFGQSQNILNLLMGGIQNPRIPPALSALTEQAFQPAMGDIASQAIESARRRGFAGGADLLNTGPGGAIAGPALSNLQGQMAQAKLNLYQNNIINLLNALQGSQQGAFAQGRVATGLPSIERKQSPQPSLIDTLKTGTGLFSDIAKLGQAAGAAPGPGIGSWLSGLNPMNWFGNSSA